MHMHAGESLMPDVMSFLMAAAISLYKHWEGIEGNWILPIATRHYCALIPSVDRHGEPPRSSIVPGNAITRVLFRDHHNQDNGRDC